MCYKYMALAHRWGFHNGKLTTKDIEVTDTLIIKGNMTFGDAATDTLTVTGTITVADSATFSKEVTALGLFNTATELTESGAIPANTSYVELNNSTTKIEATIAAPAAGRFLVITQTDSGTKGHTVTLTAGTYDGSNTIATFNAAAETLVLYGISATRFVIVENIGAVGLSS